MASQGHNELRAPFDVHSLCSGSTLQFNMIIWPMSSAKGTSALESWYNLCCCNISFLPIPHKRPPIPIARPWGQGTRYSVSVGKFNLLIRILPQSLQCCSYVTCYCVITAPDWIIHSSMPEYYIQQISNKVGTETLNLLLERQNEIHVQWLWTSLW